MGARLNTKTKSRQRQGNRERLKFAIKLVIGASLIGLLLARMDGAAIVTAFRRYEVMTLAVATALTFLGIAVASLRWKLLVPEVPYLRLLRYSLIGQFYSVVLPGQVAGEAVKAWKISRGAVDAPRLVASVLIDRVVGLIGLLVVATAGIALTRDAFAARLLLPMDGLASALVVGLLALAIPPVYRLVSRLIHHTGASALRLRHIAAKASLFLGAWRDYAQSPWRLTLSLVLGVMFQLLGVVIYQLLARDMGIEIATSDWMWMAGVTAIAVLLPLSIGGIGLREGALVAMLAQFGIPGESALALSLGIFGLMLLVAVAGWIADVTDRRQVERSDGKGQP
jgi:uncharacterized protein (TIRG00374 family)